MKKLLKKCFIVIFGLVVSLLSCAGSFFAFSKINQTYAEAPIVAQTSSGTISSLLSYVSFTSRDYTYSLYDFYTDVTTDSIFMTNLQESDTYLGVLFTNTTISLHTTTLGESGYTENFSLILMEEYDHSTLASSIVDSTVVPATRENKSNLLNFGFTYSNPTIKKYKATITQTYLNPETRLPVTFAKSFVFVIAQIAEDYNMDSGVTYSYTQNSMAVSVSDMVTNTEYPPVTLSVREGTLLNPTYVNFARNGENFLIYNIEGVFYNAEGNTELTALSDNTLPLNQSGIYEILVYDNTCKTGAPTANKVFDKFIVNNTSSGTSSVFLTATTTSGDQIASGETTNESVIVKLYNTSPSIVKQITVSRTQTTGDIFTTNEVYKNSFPSIITCEDDYFYRIKIEFHKSAGGITYEPFVYTFQVIKNIRSNYQKPDGEIILAEYDNIVQNKHISQTNHLTYGYGIESTNVYNYVVKLAKSNPSISGIEHNASATGSVSLVVRGVGSVAVKINENGTEKPVEYHQSGDTIFLQNAGKYTVTITDEMGTTISKSFTINVQINTAGIILLVVGGLLVAGGLFFIIRSRAKVAVR